MSSNRVLVILLVICSGVFETEQTFHRLHQGLTYQKLSSSTKSYVIATRSPRTMRPRTAHHPETTQASSGEETPRPLFTFTEGDSVSDSDSSDYDWDYMFKAAKTRRQFLLKDLLESEHRRHHVHPYLGFPGSALHHPHQSARERTGDDHKGTFSHPHGHGASSLWVDFCSAAQVEEDPFMVNDGSFHPRYEEVPGVGVYRLHARARSWAEARKVCEREGAQLAVPNSREEALALTAIHNRCQRLLPTHFNDYQYLGVHDDYKEGGWETVVGYPLSATGYVNWAFNQPDNAHHNGENCLTMNRNTFFNDVPCVTELPFICEHP